MFYTKVPSYQKAFYEKKRQALEEKLNKQKAQFENEMKDIQLKLNKKPKSSNLVSFGGVKANGLGFKAKTLQGSKTSLTRNIKRSVTEIPGQGGDRSRAQKAMGVKQSTVKAYMESANKIKEEDESVDSDASGSSTNSSMTASNSDVSEEEPDDVLNNSASEENKASSNKPAASASQHKSTGQSSPQKPLSPPQKPEDPAVEKKKTPAAVESKLSNAFVNTPKK